MKSRVIHLESFWSEEKIFFMEMEGSLLKNMSNYQNLPLNIALEQADENQDWYMFNKFFKMDEQWLMKHLRCCDPVFQLNCFKLSAEEQVLVFFSTIEGCDKTSIDYNRMLDDHMNWKHHTFLPQARILMPYTWGNYCERSSK